MTENLPPEREEPAEISGADKGLPESTGASTVEDDDRSNVSGFEAKQHLETDAQIEKKMPTLRGIILAFDIGGLPFVILVLILIIVSIFPIQLGIGGIFASFILPFLPFFVILLRFLASVNAVDDRIDSEFTFVREFEFGSEEVQTQRRKLQKLDDIASVVPDMNLREQAISGNKLIEQVIQDGKSLNLRPITQMAESATIDLHRTLNRIASLGPLSLRLGILGTFVGFVLSMGDLAQLFGSVASTDSGDAAGVGENGSALFGGLRLAFITSIYGLIGAIIVGMLMSSRTEQLGRLRNELETVCVIGQYLANRIGLDDPNIQAGLQNVVTGLEQATKSFTRDTDTMSNGLHEHRLVVREQTQKLQTVFDGLSDLGASWSGIRTAIEQGNARSLLTFNEAIDELKKRQQNLIKAVDDNLLELRQNQSSIQGSIADVARQYDDITQPLIRISDNVEALTQELTDKQNQVNQLLSDLVSQQKQALEENLSSTMDSAYMSQMTEELAALRRYQSRPVLLIGAVQFAAAACLLGGAMFLFTAYQQGSLITAFETWAKLFNSNTGT